MTFPQQYHAWIMWIGETTGLPDPILHIHAGLAVLLAARLLTGRPLGTFVPFAFVVAAEGANEVLDYLNQGLNVTDTLSDIANTLVWPFLLSLGLRLRPPRTGRKR